MAAKLYGAASKKEKKKKHKNHYQKKLIPGYLNLK